MYIRPITLVVFFAGSLMFSCKKDTDTTSPSISISSPATSSSFNVFDTITVSAAVSDDEQLESILIRLLDQDLVPVVPTISVSANSNNVSFSKLLPISNIHLNSGTYYVNVFASDGKNDANSYVQITVVGAPLEIERYVVVSTPGVGVVRLDTIDDQFAIGLQSQFNGDHSTTSVNSYHQQIVVGGGNLSAALSLDGKYASVIWSAANLNNTSLPYFKDVRFSEDHRLTYMTNEDRQIRGYNENGGVVFSATSSSTYRPKNVIGHENLVVVELENIVPPMRRLGYFFRSSGVLWQEHPLNMEVVFMNPRNSDRLIMFGNENGQAVAEERDLDNGGYWTLTSLPSGTLNDAAAINSTNYLLAHENGLYRYSYSTNADVLLVGGINAQKVCYDKVNGIAIVAVSGELRYYDATTGAFLTSVGLQDDAEAIGVLYNK